MFPMAIDCESNKVYIDTKISESKLSSSSRTQKQCYDALEQNLFLLMGSCRLVDCH